MRILSVAAFAALVINVYASGTITLRSTCNEGQRSQITKAWEGAIKLAHSALDSRFKLDKTLQERYFATEKDGLCFEKARNKFKIIRDWHPDTYSSVPEDDFSEDIRVGCSDITNAGGVKCVNTLDGETGTIGAYAFTDEYGSVIVLCKPFFETASLEAVEQQLKDHEQYRRSLVWMRNQANVFLHEMTHLRAVGREISIEDHYIDPENLTGRKAYGPYYTERLARTRYGAVYTCLNADNYAWFATARYFEDLYGTPHIPDRPTSAKRDDNEATIFELPGENNTAIIKDDPETTLPLIRRDDEDDALNLEMMGWAKDNGLEVLVREANQAILGKRLRILALGDSITNGFGSSDNNGYRVELSNLLGGNTVSIINEGHNGATIAEISQFATTALTKRPNVVLLHAGTNDLNKNMDAGAVDRLSALIDKIQTACPDASILVSLIIGSGESDLQRRITTYNDGLQTMLANRFERGKNRIGLIDMTKKLQSTDMADGLHPNNAGYKKMAAVWHNGIKLINSFNWIKDPIGSETGQQTCETKPVWLPQGEIASGGGNGKNAYPDIVCTDQPTDTTQCACDGRVVWKVGSSCVAMGYDMIHAVHFADMNGDGRAEYLWVSSTGAVSSYYNSGVSGGKVNWIPQGNIAQGVGGSRHEVHFADLNGDGRADYIWVRSDGSIAVWMNMPVGNDQKSVKINWVSQGVMASGIGTPGSSIRFADLNGDGRAEYLSVAPDGAVTAYLNGGYKFIKDGQGEIAWISQGRIASGVGGVRNQTVFADINGDGRADYLKVERSGSGSINLWRNTGGPNNGPDAAKVGWWDLGQITGGDGSSGSNVWLADITGDGRADYLKVNPDTSAVSAYWNGCSD